MSKNWVFRHISGIFGRKTFFPAIGLRHILGIAILHLCAKNQQTDEPISRKAGNRRTNKRTNERTNGQRLIYRTSKVGPKTFTTQGSEIPE